MSFYSENLTVLLSSQTTVLEIRSTNRGIELARVTHEGRDVTRINICHLREQLKKMKEESAASGGMIVIDQQRHKIFTGGMTLTQKTALKKKVQKAQKIQNAQGNAPVAFQISHTVDMDELFNLLIQIFSSSNQVQGTKKSVAAKVSSTPVAKLSSGQLRSSVLPFSSEKGVSAKIERTVALTESNLVLEMAKSLREARERDAKRREEERKEEVVVQDRLKYDLQKDSVVTTEKVGGEEVKMEGNRRVVAAPSA